MNTITFTGSLLKNIKDRDTFISAQIIDRRPAIQPDGSTKMLFTCSRQVTIFDADIVKFIKDNLINSTSKEFMVNASGYLASTKKKDEWYDNQIITSLELA